MRIYLTFFAVLFLSILFTLRLTAQYQYLFPKPNSVYVSPHVNIILRHGDRIDRSALQNTVRITVIGEKSGVHQGTLALSDDEKTILFTPRFPFAYDEAVSVTVKDGIKSTEGKLLSGLELRFRTSKPLPSHTEGAMLHSAGETDATTQFNPDSLPSDFPPLKVNVMDNPSPGELLIGGFGGQGGTLDYANYLIVTSHAGTTLAYKRIGTFINPFAYMFKQAPNGLFSYIDRTPVRTSVKIIDTAFSVIDTYPPGDPAATSHADFLLLPNGHGLMLYFDTKIIDMSRLVRGGHPAASVRGTLIQEFDQKKNVVFQWSSFDYLPVTETYEDTLAASFAPTHVNSIELDTDGNILLTVRHMSEIIKVDRNSGEIIWRMGGKKNQFTFINEHTENHPIYFSYPHNAQRLPNGNMILFDNGNQRSVKYSRVVEYAIDELKKTATMVWEYRHTPDIYASAQGSVQRLPNGNTLIGWGDAGLPGKPSITEVRPDKSVAFEMTFPMGYRSMRVTKVPWKTSAPVVSLTRYEVLQGNTYSFNDSVAMKITGVRLTLNEVSGVVYNSITVQNYSTAPQKPQFTERSPWLAPHRVVISQYGIGSMNTTLLFDVNKLPGLPDPNQVIVYQRDTTGRGVFTALPTWYNSTKKELNATATQFGEFIFGWQDTDSLANPPILISPSKGDSVNQQRPVAFAWNPRGTVSGYQLQVALDPQFTSPVLYDSLLTVPVDTLKNVLQKTKYYWRVRTRNFTKTGEWSETFHFTTAPPSLTLKAPAPGDIWVRGNPYFITWKTNVRDRLTLELYRNNTKVITIKDSVANIGAYTWTVIPSITPDSTYRVRIRSVADSSVFSISGPITIASTGTGTETPLQLPTHFTLEQNYPNPFNPATTIRYHLPTRPGQASNQRMVALTIFDAVGREVTRTVPGLQGPGYYEIQFNGYGLASGIYYYRLHAGEYLQVRRMMLLK